MVDSMSDLLKGLPKVVGREEPLRERSGRGIGVVVERC